MRDTIVEAQGVPVRSEEEQTNGIWGCLQKDTCEKRLDQRALAALRFTCNKQMSRCQVTDSYPPSHIATERQCQLGFRPGCLVLFAFEKLTQAHQVTIL